MEHQVTIFMINRQQVGLCFIRYATDVVTTVIKVWFNLLEYFLGYTSFALGFEFFVSNLLTFLGISRETGNGRAARGGIFSGGGASAAACWLYSSH